ncbi:MULTISPECIES: PilZ domain-containing protein [Shewanella]|uniref:Pilus assembly protein PilZ n=1 Tax=Shewanella japonica TaxID=93973 RepID=A0ABM6JML3_9GAMM|nr:MULTISPECIES: PilZ domain-containing protein [Shewanella]ARD22879.1 pilus assembly protein PilZ [Shewanella japonica]MBQ4891813.1 PilZ domain-containing protein [Shewanella sp. MMG014]
MSNEHTGFEEKRQSLRVDMEAERILLHWIDANGQSHEDFGVCIDLARKGILIDYKTAFSLGDLIAITFNHQTDKQNTIKGQVCRCTQASEHSYHIAMQLL